MPVPPAAEPEVPDDAAPWLRSTACIQADDEATKELVRAIVPDLALRGAAMAYYRSLLK